jgi:GntR family transcriptional regulator
MQTTPIGRRSVVIQLRDELKSLIAAEGLQPGDQLPPEAEIAARFGVARGTVREAFKLLEQGGLIEARQGSGRFVSAIGGLRVERPVTNFESVTQMLAALGYRPTTKVLSIEVARPSEEEAAALGLRPDSDVVRLKRLRIHKGRALIYQIDTFEASLLGGESIKGEDFSRSLNEWLDARGRPPVSSAAQIRAVALPAEVAEHPELGGEEPWLLITECCVDPRGIPVAYSQNFHRGDVFTFHVLRQLAS